MIWCESNCSKTCQWSTFYCRCVENWMSCSCSCHFNIITECVTENDCFEQSHFHTFAIVHRKKEEVCRQWVWKKASGRVSENATNNFSLRFNRSKDSTLQHFANRKDSLSANTLFARSFLRSIARKCGRASMRLCSISVLFLVY